MATRMTLTTHGVVGAAAMVATTAALGTTPLGLTCAFAAGFASHMAIDAIPHWDEGGAILRSTIGSHAPLSRNAVLNKNFMRDLFILTADALLGLALSVLVFSIWLFHAPPYVILAGVVAGDLPDALQFVYFKTKFRFMTPWQKFHEEIQTELKSPLFLGIEIALMVSIIAVLKIFI